MRILGMAGQLLGRAKQSTPRSPQGARLSARGVDGERACRAIIAVPMNALRNAPKPGCVQRRFDSPWSKGPCNPQPPDNPNGTRLSPMSSVRSVTYVSGPDRVSRCSGPVTRTPDTLRGRNSMPFREAPTRFKKLFMIMENSKQSPIRSYGCAKAAFGRRPPRTWHGRSRPASETLHRSRHCGALSEGQLRANKRHWHAFLGLECNRCESFESPPADGPSIASISASRVEIVPSKSKCCEQQGTDADWHNQKAPGHVVDDNN